jgi:hypothetical protein
MLYLPLQLETNLTRNLEEKIDFLSNPSNPSKTLSIQFSAETFYNFKRTV